MPNADFTAIAAVCSKDNAGGLGQTINVIPHGNVTAIPTASAKVISTDLTLAATKVFTRFITTNMASKRTWVLEPQGDDDSGGYLLTATYFIPKITAARVDSIDGPCSLIAILPDNQGQYRLVGDLDTPATYTYKEDIADGNNGITMTIKWNIGYIPNFYTGAIAV